MSDKSRSVVLAEETDDLPVIDSVRTVTLKTTKSVDDDFKKEAEWTKTLEGTSAVFKRRVTNQLKKARRSEDGQTRSKIIEDKGFGTAYDAFEVVEPEYNIDYLAKLYERSEPHHAAVDAKVANIVGLGYRFVENTESKRRFEAMTDEAAIKAERKRLDEHRDDLVSKIEKMNEEDAFVDTLTKVWTDFETTGNGYLEVGRKKDGTIGYIGHIPAQTLRVRKKRDGFVQISGFETQFFANFGAGWDDEKKKPRPIPNPVGNDRPNEVIHIKNYSPTSSYYGVPDIVAAIKAVAGNEFAQGFNLDYFENKAVPRYAIILKGAKLGTQAETDLLSFFETSLKGQNHRSIYIPLPGDSVDNKVELKLEAIEAGIQDASFLNYHNANKANIFMVHRVPETKVSVSSSASLALAKDADKTFKEQVCNPRQKSFEKKLDKIIRELTDALELKLNEMTLTDENTQSQIDERRRKTGVETANEQRIRRGEPAIEGGDELFDMNGATKVAQERAEATTNRERDAVRSASATDSAGAARNPKGEGRSSP